MAGRKPLFVLLSLLMATAVVAGEVPSFSPPADTPVIPWTRFNIQYAVRIVGNNKFSKVVFYITSDGGKSWKFYAEDADKKSPMVVQVPGEGTYGFATVVGTQYRPASTPKPGTQPDRFVIVDRTPPKARWLSPLKGDIRLGADGKIKLAWEASDSHLGVAPVSLEYSTDGGRYWLPLRDKLAAKGEFGWAPPLLEGENEIMLRLIARDLAGNRRIVRNRATFSIDRNPPLVKIIGPTSSGKYEFDVQYTAQDDASGVAQVDLYYTVNGGKDWYYSGADKDGTSPIRFSAPPDARQVGLYLVAVDRRGNRSLTPNKGTPPMATVLLDLQPPQVTVLPPFTNARNVLRLNQPQRISWSAADVNIDPNSAVIEYSADGGSSWNSIGKGLPANGSYAWTPVAAGDNFLLKISVSDTMGNVGSVTSMPFRIDANAPDTTIDDVRPIPSDDGRGTTTTPSGSPWTPTLGGESTETDVSIPGMVDSVGDPVVRETVTTTETVDITPPVADVTATTDTSVPPIAGNPVTDVTETTTETVDIPIIGDTETAPIGGIPDVPSVGMTDTPADTATPPTTDTGISIPDVPTTPADTGTSPVPAPENPVAVPDVPSIGTTPSGGAESGTPSTSIPDIPAIGTSDITGGTDIGMTTTTPSASGADAAVSVTADTLLEQAEQAYGARQYDQSEKLSLQALKKDPNSARAYALLSSVYTEKGKYKDAIDSAQRAIQLAPGQTRYLQIRGYAYYAKAQDIARQINSKKIDQPQQQRFVREAARALDIAEENYRQMLGTANKADLKEAYYRLGQIDYMRATRMTRDNAAIEASLRRAISNYEKAFSSGAPEYREVLQIGICNYRLKNYDQAEKWLEKAQEVAPPDRPAKEAFFYLAMIYEMLEHPEQALPFWEKVAQQYDKGSKYQILGERRAKALRRKLNL